MEINKYIIRNCPVCEFSDWEECTGYLAEGYICNDIHIEIVECQDRINCVMKQIVELCKDVKLTYGRLDKPLTATQCTALFSRATLADEILKLLDIQEVE